MSTLFLKFFIFLKSFIFQSEITLFTHQHTIAAGGPSGVVKNHAIGLFTAKHVGVAKHTKVHIFVPCRLQNSIKAVLHTKKMAVCHKNLHTLHFKGALVREVSVEKIIVSGDKLSLGFNNVDVNVVASIV